MKHVPFVNPAFEHPYAAIPRVVYRTVIFRGKTTCSIDIVSSKRRTMLHILAIYSSILAIYEEALGSAARARSRSAMMSGRPSMPTERRMRLSEMPISLRTSGAQRRES